MGAQVIDEETQARRDAELKTAQIMNNFQKTMGKLRLKEAKEKGAAIGSKAPMPTEQPAVTAGGDMASLAQPTQGPATIGVGMQAPPAAPPPAAGQGAPPAEEDLDLEGLALPEIPIERAAEDLTARLADLDAQEYRERESLKENLLAMARDGNLTKRQLAMALRAWRGREGQFNNQRVAARKTFLAHKRVEQENTRVAMIQQSKAAQVARAKKAKDTAEQLSAAAAGNMKKLLWGAGTSQMLDATFQEGLKHIDPKHVDDVTAAYKSARTIRESIATDSATQGEAKVISETVSPVTASLVEVNQKAYDAIAADKAPEAQQHAINDAIMENRATVNRGLAALIKKPAGPLREKLIKAVITAGHEFEATLPKTAKPIGVSPQARKAEAEFVKSHAQAGGMYGLLPGKPYTSFAQLPAALKMEFYNTLLTGQYWPTDALYYRSRYADLSKQFKGSMVTISTTGDTTVTTDQPEPGGPGKDHN
jgi:hypothetical protein